MIQLDGKNIFDGLLVCDYGTPYGTALDVLALARDAFFSVSMIHNEKTVSGWPAGPNSLWLTAAKHLEEHLKSHWLFLESDAIPLCAGWAGVIEHEYHHVGNPFLGCRLESTRADLPPVHLNGVAVYPRTAYSILGKIVAESSLAFDMSTAAEVVPTATFSNKIQVVWGQNNLPPTFQAVPQPGTNIFSLDNLKT